MIFNVSSQRQAAVNFLLLIWTDWNIQLQTNNPEVIRICLCCIVFFPFLIFTAESCSLDTDVTFFSDWNEGQDRGTALPISFWLLFSFFSFLVEFISGDIHSENQPFYFCLPDGKEGKNKETAATSSSTSSSSAKPKVKSSSSIAGIALCWQGVVQRQVRHTLKLNLSVNLSGISSWSLFLDWIMRFLVKMMWTA